jgi:type IV secretion system protein VirB9
MKLISSTYLALSILPLTFSSFVHAVDIPAAVPNDTRIRAVNYKANEVTLIKVKRGTATRIILDTDEQIEVAVSGLSARCDSDQDEWCISAVKGKNYIFIRPRDAAKRNNMELHTNKRDYSFDFQVLPDSGNEAGPVFYRVIFNYPKHKLSPAETTIERAAAVDDLLRKVEASSHRTVGALDPHFGMSPAEILKAQGMTVRNASYSKQILDSGADADPTMVFDDGRFTYFEFSGTREIPAIFAYGSDGEPTRVNWHMQSPFIVVQRTARKFTLRLGKAVVGVFNEAFDPTGVDTPNATVSPLVRREMTEANR